MCPILKPNEGTTDRVIRVMLGVVLIGLAYFKLSGNLRLFVGVIGLAGLITGFIGYCALYKILGFTTFNKKK